MTSVVIFFIWLLLALKTNVNLSSHTLQDVKDVYAYIFRDYDKRIIPLIQQGESLPVYVDFKIRSINEFDEKTQRLAISGFFIVYWTDESLYWNMSNFNYVNHVHSYGQETWLPNIALVNTYGKITMLAEKPATIIIFYNGEVMWISGDSYVVSCEVDITYYPFDTQKCNLLFEMWDSPVSEVALLKFSESLNLDFFQENVEWKLVGYEVLDSLSVDNAMTSFTKYTIHLQRRPQFIILTIVAPVILLAFLNVCVFLIPSSSGEKNSFCVTVYLSYAVFLGIISSELPHNSQHVSYLTIYLLALLVFSVVIVLITVIQVRICLEYGDTPAPPSVLKVFCMCVRGNQARVVPSDTDPHDLEEQNRMGGGNEKETAHISENKLQICMRDVMPKLDVPLFLIFMTILVVFTIVMGMFTYSRSF
ncbi:neuronal acetylcholine receptor subunit beta-3-like [Argopecten irradians]|uniref:neuronal acetylcholine receptor subunit beta-3-like n=1 Tax=Argopecten irradians TaxID=31199 RepID=UPI003722CE9E